VYFVLLARDIVERRKPEVCRKRADGFARAKRVTFVAVWSFTAVLLCTRPAEADEASTAPTESTSLAPVIVTAQRRSESLQAVPISMSAITGDSLDNLGIKRFDQYAGMVPNLSLGTGAGSGGAGTGFGVSTTKTITIRGVFGDNTTGVYLDDSPVPPSMDPRLLELERVEVLRGPQGTLFGAGSMGGTVRFVARQPSAGQVSGKIEAEGSYADHGTGGYSVNGTLNVPLMADNVALRVSALSAFDPGLFTRTWGGLLDPRSPILPYPPGGAPIGQKDHVGAEQDTGVMASLRVTPQAVPGLTITPMFMYQRSSSNGYPLADYTAHDFVQTRPLDVPEAVGDTWDFESLTIKQDAGFGRFIVLGNRFYRNGYDLEDTTDATAQVFFTLPYYVPAPLIDNLYFRDWTGEARFESTLKGPLQFVAGVYWSQEDRFYHQYYYGKGFDATSGGMYGTDLIFLQNTPNADRQRAAYVDVTYQVTEAFQVSAGMRVAHIEHDGTYVASGPLNGGVSSNYAAHAENDKAPRYTAKYQISPAQMVYASSAKGFRIGGTNPYVPPQCGSALASLGITNGHEFKSDSLWSYELGLKSSWLDGRVNTRVAVYDIDWKNTQHTVVLPCYWSIVSNIGSTSSKGVELEIDAVPVEHLTVNLSTGFENAKVTDASVESNTVAGQPLQNTPRWTAATTMQYSLPLRQRTGFIMGQYTYTDTRVSYNNSTTGLSLPAYGLVNVRAGINQGPWQAALFVRNLFDTLGVTGDLLPDSAQLPGRPRLFVTRPRTMGIQVRRDF
jgi:outer membrane receptor protein involved in Fe transport